VLGDGKPGHENQSLGLAEALGRLRACDVRRLPLGGISRWMRVSRAMKLASAWPKPDLLLGAGHATHWTLFRLASKLRARSVVLMKPSLPVGWFDLCIAPAHDFPGTRPPENVVTTMGAMNRVPFDPEARRSGGVMLVGGPSASHGWDEEGMLARLEDVVADAAPGYWRLTTSRRTPAGMLARLRERLSAVEVWSCEDTGPDWVPARLGEVAEAWVTADSVSMVYEALSSGARVGLLPVPEKIPDSRVLRGLADLLDRGFLTGYETWRAGRTLAAPPHVLREADRCAALVLERTGA
jgi:mitochondrial fission protein ELM1